MEDKILRVVYTFFIGILIAFFVGFGVNTFYPPPQAPKSPEILNIDTGKEPSDAQKTAENLFVRQYSKFEDTKMKPYNRNVSMIILAAAVILLAISIVFEKKIKVIADGIMLGGLFSLLYSLGRGFASADSKYVFIAVTLGLIATLYLGYDRFVKNQPKIAKAK